MTTEQLQQWQQALQTCGQQQLTAGSYASRIDWQPLLKGTAVAEGATITLDGESHTETHWQRQFRDYHHAPFWRRWYQRFFTSVPTQLELYYYGKLSTLTQRLMSAQQPHIAQMHYHVLAHCVQAAKQELPKSSPLHTLIQQHLNDFKAEKLVMFPDSPNAKKPPTDNSATNHVTVNTDAEESLMAGEKQQLAADYYYQRLEALLKSKKIPPVSTPRFSLRTWFQPRSTPPKPATQDIQTYFRRFYKHSQAAMQEILDDKQRGDTWETLYNKRLRDIGRYATEADMSIPQLENVRIRRVVGALVRLDYFLTFEPPPKDEKKKEIVHCNKQITLIKQRLERYFKQYDFLLHATPSKPNLAEELSLLSGAIQRFRAQLDGYYAKLIALRADDVSKVEQLNQQRLKEKQQFQARHQRLALPAEAPPPDAKENKSSTPPSPPISSNSISLQTVEEQPFTATKLNETPLLPSHPVRDKARVPIVPSHRDLRPVPVRGERVRERVLDSIAAQQLFTELQDQRHYLSQLTKHYPQISTFDPYELNVWHHARQQHQAAYRVFTSLYAQLIASYPPQEQKAQRQQYALQHAEIDKQLWQPLHHFYHHLLQACHRYQSQPNVAPDYKELQAYYAELCLQTQQLITATVDQELQTKYQQALQQWNINMLILMGETFLPLGQPQQPIIPTPLVTLPPEFKEFKPSILLQEHLAYQFECGLFETNSEEKCPVTINSQLRKEVETLSTALLPSDQDALPTGTVESYRKSSEARLHKVKQYAAHYQRVRQYPLPPPQIPAAKHSLWQQACAYMLAKGWTLRQRYLNFKHNWLSSLSSQAESKLTSTALVPALPTPKSFIPKAPSTTMPVPIATAPPPTSQAETSSTALVPLIPTSNKPRLLIITPSPDLPFQDLIRETMLPSSSSMPPVVGIKDRDTPSWPLEVVTPSRVATGSFLAAASLNQSIGETTASTENKIPTTKLLTIEHLCKQGKQLLADFPSASISLIAERSSELQQRFKVFCHDCQQLIMASSSLQRPQYVGKLAELQMQLLKRHNAVLLTTYLTEPCIFNYGLGALPPPATSAQLTAEQRKVLKDVTLASVFDIDLQQLISTAVLRGNTRQIPQQLKSQVKRSKLAFRISTHPDKYSDSQKIATQSSLFTQIPQDLAYDWRHESSSSPSKTLYVEWKDLFNTQFEKINEWADQVAEFKYNCLPLCPIDQHQWEDWQDAYKHAYAQGQLIKYQFQFFQLQTLSNFLRQRQQSASYDIQTAKQALQLSHHLAPPDIHPTTSSIEVTSSDAKFKESMKKSDEMLAGLAIFKQQQAAREAELKCNEAKFKRQQEERDAEFKRQREERDAEFKRKQEEFAKQLAEMQQKAEADRAARDAEQKERDAEYQRQQRERDANHNLKIAQFMQMILQMQQKDKEVEAKYEPKTTQNISTPPPSPTTQSEQESKQGIPSGTSTYDPHLLPPPKTGVSTSNSGSSSHSSSSLTSSSSQAASQSSSSPSSSPSSESSINQARIS